MCLSSQRRCDSRSRRTRPAAVASRFCSMVRIPISWRRRSSNASSSRAVSSGRGLGSARVTAAKWASTRASMASVLARCPIALAKSRTWRGLTTSTGSPARQSAAATAASRPPVASRTTRRGRSGASRATSSAWPSGVLATVKTGASPTATSSLALETSMPTNVSGGVGPMRVISSGVVVGVPAGPALRSGLCGRATVRARGRVVGRDGDPSSSAISEDPRGDGLPSRGPLRSDAISFPLATYKGVPAPRPSHRVGGEVEGVDLGLGQVVAAGHVALVPGPGEPRRRLDQLLLPGPREDGAEVLAGLVGGAAGVGTLVLDGPLVDPVEELADVLALQLLDRAARRPTAPTS